jgi:hypothetical protein
LKDFSKIYYSADGSAPQCKHMKKFINLCYHKDDFDMDAERYFFHHMALMHMIGLWKQLKGGSKTYTMLSGALITTPWCIFRLQMEMASR